MKKTLIFILLLSIGKTFSQNEYELLRKDIVKNKIEEVQIFNTESSKKYLLEHIYYDNFGNILKDINYNEDGSVWFKNLYQYDENQRTISSLDKNNWVTKYKYDESGNTIEIKKIRLDSTVFFHYKMIYNKKNQKVKTFCKNENNDDFYLKENFFYDEDALTSKIEKFDQDGKLICTEEFEYDKNRNLIYIYRQLINDKKRKTKYIYNENGDLIKVEYPTGIYRKFKYDEYGKRIELLTIDPSGKIIQHRKYWYKKFE